MLDFYLDPRSGVPYYRQIIDQIRFGMATGQVKVGEQLPTVRALAVKLQVNLNTVTKAYKELEIQKILETQQGTGTFIGSVKVEVSAKERRAKLKSLCEEFVNAAAVYGISPHELADELKQYKGGKK
ncbi:GntR family transcriptional regulator [Pelagicoccus enzymogenes]|uniref:GntR family transcriptional regulator n=1 Tax=Pelagicoccus enzymogenes TaxID=2773457 RepID=UPI00280C49CB|nr:GntR family transcriptional regulator [Pelagicoccus enzymogenes]MDQ8198666.1 GntR family transcriptional regulator [Pelagicoccus enzymogenes]